MPPIDRCPDCDAALDNGLCPRCLVGLGLKGAGLVPAPGASTLDLPARPGSVLESIAATIGGLTRVLLRDTAFGETPSPIVRPTSGDDPANRYRIDGEIARGGMGSILKGRDPDLGRDVAIKVLREDLRSNADLIRRFVEEAQIGAQLQHPGIVPIYELGTFADRRPFFAMKLVKGQTLADLLSARPTPAADLPRFLAIFAAMCQTMAYAHTRGVIHRDLKPSNVMVGSFGEVQVMDWGLAKVLARGGVVNDAKAGKEKPPETLIATARSGSDRDLSHAGSVLGTPSYMPPEQARGEVDLIDERADVFALGSILCEMLTGTPAFTGRNSGEILRKAAKGDTADVLKRLERSGAEADLIVLAKDCLQAEHEDRPRDANIVAERITAYLASVQERVQIAERERAVAEARTIEERKRRRLQLGLAASVLAITAMGGLGLLYEQRQRSARAATVARVIGEATTLRDLARATPEDVARWQTALAALKQAEGVAGNDAEALQQLAALRAEVKAGAEAADRDKTLLDKLVDIRSAKADDRSGNLIEAAYAGAFHDAGIDLAALPPAEAGARIKARPPGVVLALSAALDDWSSVRRDLLSEPAGAARLAEVARLADPDPWRDDLRVTLADSEKGRRQQRLQALAKLAKFDELGPVSLDLLGNALVDAGDPATAEQVLRRAQVRHPADVWINYDLGKAMDRLHRRDEAIRFYTAARALRPETAHELAHALSAKGESDEAIEVLRDLVRLRPKMGRHSGCLGSKLNERGRSKEAAEVLEQAVAVLREAIRLTPGDAEAHANLATALSDQGKPDEAIAEYRQAIRLKPDKADAHNNLGNVLDGQGKLDEAIAEFREMIRLLPDEALGHSNLGTGLLRQGKFDAAIFEYREATRLKPDKAEAHYSLGRALAEIGKFDEAIAEYREAIRLKPDLAEAHGSLGFALKNQGKFDEAIAEYREAIRLNPESALAHSNLGSALGAQGKLDEAVAELREAIRLDPKDATAHNNLGNAFIEQEKYAEAVAACREAIRLKPDYTLAHLNLGTALGGLGQLDESIAELREAIRLDPNRAEAYSNISNALRDQGKFDEAVTACRESIRLLPGYAEAHCNLGNALEGQGKLDAAIAADREAIRLRPGHAGAYMNLGSILRSQGDYAGSLAMVRRGHELGSKQPGWRVPSAQWLAEAERLAALAGRLPALLKGDDQLKDNAERLTLAQICYDTKRHAAAARLWAEALDADPKLGDDRQVQHRYNAACAAALAGSGQGKDDLPPDDDAKAKLRGQALGWLKAELAAWTRLLESGPPQARPLIAQILDHWKQDGDLAGLRDPDALAGRPEAEREACRALWAEVDALLARVKP